MISYFVFKNNFLLTNQIGFRIEFIIFRCKKFESNYCKNER